MSNILDPSVILSSLPKYLPQSKTLTRPHDGVAALSHSILSALGFRLVGVDDSSSSTFAENVLPDEWNAHGPGSYTLRYRHDQSSLEFIVKITKLGTRTLINAIASETDKTASLDIPTDDFVSPSFFPYDAGTQDAAPLVHGFISSNRVADFVARFKLAIVQKLIPGLRKEGYTEDDDASTNSTSNTREQPSSEPAARPGPSRPFAPLNEPYRPSGLESHIPPQNPLQIGRSDLDPLPLQIQPNPFAPPPLFPPNRGDGMYVGPDHPIFDGPRRGMGSPPNRGPWGGDGFLPPMSVPQGARFDPILPGPMGPGGNPLGRRGGGSGRRGGPGSGQRSGEPDNDEFMPPGMSDMFS
ncbi:uncharacterized protein FOMMEDRAFT_125897 [Fomitiporia mediterranea MF3/22]|uniref:uncharacterized protein n=1 Tax=Fomitiporia mediterranea (strain MF3/22) TaxID=694068 RepID=UPI0004409C5C|nr:uncharacterized protein FOMMEDRAFT_125897 [Fomitiporia mediterranea MF3/22]EJD01182.1 hypothetical protein FOMMEDRAFT_125897 [Fomitiporia mediterranea MF3/22]